MSDTLFNDPQSQPKTGSLADDILKTQTRLKSQAVTDSQSAPDKGGRRKGTKVVVGADGKKRVVDATEAIKTDSQEASSPQDDVLSPANVGYFLNPILDTVTMVTGAEISKEERSDGATLHASCIKRHAPAWLKNYADIALCLGWWAGIGMKAGLKIKLQQGVIIENTENPENTEAKPAETTIQSNTGKEYRVGGGSLANH